MGCNIEMVKWLDEQGAFPKAARILDIGEACLLHATPDDIVSFVVKHKQEFDVLTLHKAAVDYAYRSSLFGHHSIRTLFLSELIELTDLQYVSFDVVNARKAELFDLNVHHLADDKKGTFDLVLNFGTTEHLINQYNAFQVIHDATRVGGLMFHMVPATGYLDHGYFCYNGLMFQELAQANGYDLVHLWFDGPQGITNVLVNANVHPSVTDPTKPQNNVEGFRQAPVPYAVINVLLRKTRADEFRVGLEVRTAADTLKQNFFDSAYIHAKQRQKPVSPAPKPDESRPVVRKLLRWVGDKFGLRSRRAG
jgi:hypothetical protein